MKLVTQLAKIFFLFWDELLWKNEESNLPWGKLVNVK